MGMRSRQRGGYALTVPGTYDLRKRHLLLHRHHYHHCLHRRRRRRRHRKRRLQRCVGDYGRRCRRLGTARWPTFAGRARRRHVSAPPPGPRRVATVAVDDDRARVLFVRPALDADDGRGIPMRAKRGRGAPLEPAYRASEGQRRACQCQCGAWPLQPHPRLCPRQCPQLSSLLLLRHRAIAGRRSATPDPRCCVFARWGHGRGGGGRGGRAGR